MGRGSSKVGGGGGSASVSGSVKGIDGVQAARDIRFAVRSEDNAQDAQRGIASVLRSVNPGSQFSVGGETYYRQGGQIILSNGTALDITAATKRIYADLI